jgi:hypothetical protein
MSERFVGRGTGPKPTPGVQEAREIIDKPQVFQTKPRIRSVEQEDLDPPDRFHRHVRIPNPRGQSKITYAKDRGFGLYACRNCRWYREQASLFHEPSSPVQHQKTCQDCGISPSDLPCPVRNIQYGYFTPMKIGREKDVQIDHLNPDELMLLNLRVLVLMNNKLYNILRHYRVGEPVRFDWRGEIMTGIVRKITKHRIRVETADGVFRAVHPGDLVDQWTSYSDSP